MTNELSQMCINGVDYELKDSVARQNMISVTDAKVGQTIKIAEVDFEGAPTKWEAANVSGGGCEVAVEGKALVISNDGDSSGVYELIDNVVIEQDGITNYVLSENLRIFRFEVTVPITSDTSPNANWYAYKLDGSGKKYAAGYHYMSPFWSNTVKYYHTAESILQGGLCVVEYVDAGLSADAGLNRGNPKKSTLSTDVNKPYVEITLSPTSNMSFPIGTQIKIMGVRA